MDGGSVQRKEPRPATAGGGPSAGGGVRRGGKQAIWERAVPRIHVVTWLGSTPVRGPVKDLVDSE